MNTITITMPEGQVSDLLHLLRAIQEEKEHNLSCWIYHPDDEEKKEQLEAEIALLDITIEQLETKVKQ